jgi:hypothetical protein
MSSNDHFCQIEVLTTKVVTHKTAVIYGFRNKLVFAPGEHFQPSLVFRDKRSSL